jgi:hypothetical protein
VPGPPGLDDDGEFAGDEGPDRDAVRFEHPLKGTGDSPAHQLADPKLGEPHHQHERRSLREGLPQRIRLRRIVRRTKQQYLPRGIEDRSDPILPTGEGCDAVGGLMFSHTTLIAKSRPMAGKPPIVSTDRATSYARNRIRLEIE